MRPGDDMPADARTRARSRGAPRRRGDGCDGEAGLTCAAGRATGREAVPTQLSHGIVHLWGLGMDWGRPEPSPRGCPAPVGTFAQDSQAAQGDCEAAGPLLARRDPSLSRRNARNGLDSCTDAAIGPSRPSPTRPRPVHKSRICTGRLEELRRRLPGASGALRPRSRTPLEPSEPPAAPDAPALRPLHLRRTSRAPRAPAPSMPPPKTL